MKDMMDSTTLLACNRRYIVAATGDRIATRRTNETLTLLKPDYLGHKGEVTHVAIHQPDHCYGTQDDWGRVVASSDTTHRVKVWLCDGEEEELMFARNMAEYVGYEKVTALGWTGDSKVAIGDASGNFIVFNARYATSRYNRTVAKAITAIAPSHTDPHIHAVGYGDGSILLIRTNPSFQILFTNSVAHTGPVVSLAWRPEFSAPRTYTEKDGKVHKSAAEDMALLASCPTSKGEFRIWAWSSKTEKLSGFRDEKKDGADDTGSASVIGGLHWSRNGKVVQLIEGEVRVWDVRKLQIQSELFIPSSADIQGIAVDGHHGTIYTLSPSGVEKHVIPAKAGSSQAPPTPIPPPTTTSIPTPLDAPNPSRTPTPPAATNSKQVETPKVSDLAVSSPVVSLPSISEPEAPTDLKPPIEDPLERSSSELSIDSLTKVKQMAKNIDDDPGLARKRNNFIATAKAKYSFERRKRTISNDDLMTLKGKTESPEKSVDAGQRTVSGGSQLKQPSIFDIATSGNSKAEHTRLQNRAAEIKAANATIGIKNDLGTRDDDRLGVETRTSTPESVSNSVPDVTRSMPSQPSPSFKPLENNIRRANTPPISIDTSSTTVTGTSQQTQNHIIPQHSILSPVVDRLQQEAEFVESPILGESMVSEVVPIEDTTESIPPSPIVPESPPRSISPTPLETIAEETPALKIVKVDSPIHRNNGVSGIDSFVEDSEPTLSPTRSNKGVVDSRDVPRKTLPGVSSPQSSSTSSKLAEPTSSYEDLGGISMDDQDNHDDARSDTSVESMEDTKLPTSKIPRSVQPFDVPVKNSVKKEIIEDKGSPISPPINEKMSPTRASKIWAEKHGKKIHTQIVEYLSDGEEATPSPLHKADPAPETVPVKAKGSVASSSDSSSPAPYKTSLKEYDLFRGLTRNMERESKENLENVLGVKLTQNNICKTFFGYETVKILVKEELKYAREHNIGLTELLLKLWLGMEIDDEALLKALLFGKNNGLSDALILSIAPLAGVETWESLILWCTETDSSVKSDQSCADIVKVNQLARTHLFAGFLCFNGSWEEAVKVYRKAKMYREAILMSLMTLVLGDISEDRLVNTMKDLFRSWGDQVASQEGNGLLVSMCFAASMMTFEPISNSRTPGSLPKSAASSPLPTEPYRSRKASDATLKSAQSSVIPVIRTQRPSPTGTESSSTSKNQSNSSDSPHGRNWAELATFMRTQREKGFNEIRVPKTVQFQDLDSPRSTKTSSPLPRPLRPDEREGGSQSRSNSPLPPPRFPIDRGGARSTSPGGRQPPTRRYTDDEEWSRRRRASPKEYGFDGPDRIHAPAPRRPGIPIPVTTAHNRAPVNDPHSRRRDHHDQSSPLTFGARGASVKPNGPPGHDAPPIPIKDGKREVKEDRGHRKLKEDDIHARRRELDIMGVGLGIHAHSVRERVARV